MSRSYLMLPLLCTAVACSSEPSSPSDAIAPLTVYTQNVYVGTDVDAVLSAPPELVQARVGAALQQFQETNWPSRAGDIAATIASNNPDLVALNEVSTLTVHGLAPLAPDFTLEFLPILMQQLAAKGLQYSVGGKVSNVDATLALGPASIRLQDFDVVLVRNGVTVSNVVAQNYAAFASVPLPLGTVDLKRGFVALDATRDGRTIRFVSTHLEPRETSATLQLAQADQLTALLATSKYPVVIAGDLNSDPLENADETPYKYFLANGYRDPWQWAENNGTAGTFTCCQAPSLTNATSGLVKRIDHVLLKGFSPVSRTVVVSRVADSKGSDGMYPSDHAGLVVTLPWP